MIAPDAGAGKRHSENGGARSTVDLVIPQDPAGATEPPTGHHEFVNEFIKLPEIRRARAVLACDLPHVA
jgi:hypothetical protein